MSDRAFHKARVSITEVGEKTTCKGRSRGKSSIFSDSGVCRKVFSTDRFHPE